MKTILPKLTVLAILTILLLSCYGCKDDNTTDDDMMVTNPYEGCCATAPASGNWGAGEYYIPNIFTPNNDGINDVFFVLGNTGIKQVDSFVIRDKDGDVLFERQDFMPNDIAHSWNGVGLDGNTYRGSFFYRAVLRDMGDRLLIVEGDGCSLLCIAGEDTSSIPSADCFFSVQNDGQGGLDENLPSMDEDCF